MLGWRRRGTIIGAGLKVAGKVTTEGLVKVYGQIEGELRCASLILTRKAQVIGAIAADKAVIDGRVEGPIEATIVVLKSHAHVVGDIDHQSLVIRKGAYFEGRSVHAQRANEREQAGKKHARLWKSNLEVVPTADSPA